MHIRQDVPERSQALGPLVHDSPRPGHTITGCEPRYSLAAMYAVAVRAAARGTPSYYGEAYELHDAPSVKVSPKLPLNR